MLTFGITSLAVANPLKTEKETRALADSIMEKVGVEEYQAAFELAKPYWPVGVGEIEGLAEKTKTQIKGIEPRYGKIVGKEFIGSVKLGDSYQRYSYILKLEKHSLKWNIVFYKPKDTWLVNLIFWNDKPSELIPEFGVVEKTHNKK